MTDDRKRPNSPGRGFTGERKPFERSSDKGQGGKFDKPRAPYGKRNEGEERPFRARSEGGPRTSGERSGGERSGGQREFGARPGGSREGGSREGGSREGGFTPRPKTGFGRPGGDRPGGDRPRGDRPGGDRPRGDRPGGDRPRDGQGRSGPSRERGRDEQRTERRDSDRSRMRPEIAENAINGERIAKRLARAGISSRRDAEALIADGRIRVNGVVLDSPARNVTSQDYIELDGKPIPEIERTRLFLFHKPAGLVTTTRDPEGRRTVFERLPADLPRLITVGRLDINTEGLLLLTNDGGLARVLELPATAWTRRYRVRVHGTVDEAKLAELKNGIAVDGVFYGAIEATLDHVQGANAWLSVALREGKNREVKNVLGALGLDVTRLIRISFGPFQLGDLKEGDVHELKGRYLRDQLGDRLIAESGAVFDLPERPMTPALAPERAESREPLLNRKREREDRREDALGRLDTRPRGGFSKEGFSKDGGRGSRDKPGFGAKPRGGAGRGEKPEPTPARDRHVNVWMAPGAKPQGKRRFGDENARDERPRHDGPRHEGPRTDGFRNDRGDRPQGAGRYGKPEGEQRGFGDRNADKRSFGDRPARKPYAPNDGAGRENRGGEGRPPREARPDGFRNDRGDRPQGAGRYGKPEGEQRSFGDRSADKRFFGDRPARKPYTPNDGPRGEGRPPREARPDGFRNDRGDRPQGASRYGKPEGEQRNFSDRPASDRPRSGGFDKSSRPSSGKPSFGKPAFGKPSFGDKGKPGGFKSDRPSGPRADFKGGDKGKGPSGGPRKGPSSGGMNKGPRGADRRR